MLKSLSYSVTFPTGRTLARELSFDAGITAITGPNEAGKSMIIEVVRFCLFGSEALRGVADDYKTLKATLAFSVKGEEFRVERTIRNAKLFNGELLATGTKPVNQRIAQILGFDLAVFDVACAANQGDIEKLSKLRPAERKRMVDQVIGADRIEELAKWCGEEALLLGREIAALERGLVEPPEPPRPEGYLASSMLGDRVAELRKVQAELHQLGGWLQNQPEGPVAPVDPGGEGAEELERQIAGIDAVEAERRRLLAIPVYDFDPEEVRAQWEAHDLWQERTRFDRENPRPDLPLEQIKAEELRGRQLIELTQLEQQRDHLLNSQTATCPCGQTFLLSHATLAEVQAKITHLGDVDRRPIDMTQLARQREAHRNWAEPETLTAWGKVKDAVSADLPKFPRHPPAGGMPRVERDALLATLPHTGDRKCLQEALQARRAYDAAVSVHGRLQAAYEAWQAEAEKKAARVLELTPLVEPLPDLERRLREAQIYEQAHTRYLADREAYDERAAELEAKRSERESWLNGKDGLNELREQIKTHLVPALSRIASVLLHRMTGGARSTIVVDHDFEVTVDGQPLGTLSGSGKACANLALRIGLGQVLTNNMLSIFIGDEIDASMDDERAAHVQTALESVVGNVAQVLVVTHKEPVVQQRITLQ